MDITLQQERLQKTHRNDLLKIIALVTMFIDHLGMLYFPEHMIFRTIGRIAYPIFAYQIAIGFQMTSSRVRYGLRLFLFACIAQVPYLWFNPEVQFNFGSLNIMFTFFFALLALQCYEQGKYLFKPAVGESINVLKSIAALGYWLLMISIMVLPEMTRLKFGHGIEYGVFGILFVFLFYFLGRQKLPLLLGYICLSALSAYYSMARYYYSSAPSILTFFEAFTSYKVLFNYMTQGNNAIWSLTGVFFQSRSVMAIPIIWLGNYIDNLGQIKIHLNKYVGYWFYPVHISILVLVRVVLKQ